jgi:L-2-hydroxyglutarate oxidase LhgO
VKTKFVFIGAGGGALPLLEKSGIPEGRGYGGFPVSGIWLRCDNPEINKRALSLSSSLKSIRSGTQCFAIPTCS